MNEVQVLELVLDPTCSSKGTQLKAKLTKVASDPCAPPTLQLLCELDGTWQHLPYMQLT